MAIRVEGQGLPKLVAQPKPMKTRRHGVSAAVRSGLVPAAARPPTTLSQPELQLSGDAIEVFAKAVGGRNKLLATLAVADVDGRCDQVVNCLLDPAYAGWSLRRICLNAGITVADLFASYKRALFVEAHIQAAHTITSKLPPIVEDVMTRAAPEMLTCPRCFGHTTLPANPDARCLTCGGTGQIRREPELDRQKLALELGHLTAQRAGVLVQQNQFTAGGSGPTLNVQSTGALEQLQQAVGELLFAPGRRRAASPPAIDAEVATVPVEPPVPRPPNGAPPPEDEDDLVDDPDDAPEAEEDDDEPDEPRQA